MINRSSTRYPWIIILYTILVSTYGIILLPYLEFLAPIMSDGSLHQYLSFFHSLAPTMSAQAPSPACCVIWNPINSPHVLTITLSTKKPYTTLLLAQKKVSPSLTAQLNEDGVIMFSDTYKCLHPKKEKNKSLFRSIEPHFYEASPHRRIPCKFLI